MINYTKKIVEAINEVNRLDDLYKDENYKAYFFIGIKVDSNVLFGQNEIGKFIAKLIQEDIKLYEEFADDIKHKFCLNDYIPKIVSMWVKDEVIMARLCFPEYGDVDLPIHPTREIYKAIKNELKRG